MFMIMVTVEWLECDATLRGTALTGTALTGMGLTGIC